MSGKAVDTILCASTQGAAAAFPTTIPAVAPDSLTIRSAVGESKARIMAFITAADAVGNKFRVTSPLLHDPNTGLTWVANENPSQWMIPEYAAVEVNQQDTLLVQGQCGAATTITVGVVVSYDDIRGTDAALYRWHDISGDIEYIKVIEVKNLAIAVGAWTDTVITNTEDQLHANKSYAVLGWLAQPSIDLVGIKGVCTGNLRMCGPGFPGTIEMSDYFISMAEYHQMPYIPVFQANDRKGVFVSAANHAAIGAAASTVSLVVAQLKHVK